MIFVQDSQNTLRKKEKKKKIENSRLHENKIHKTIT